MHERMLFVVSVAFFGMLICRCIDSNTPALISEGEDGIEEEHHAVDDGYRTLGEGQPPTFGLEAALPGLQNQHPGRDEHGASDQAEENVDLLVDRVAHQVASEETDQDDGISDEGTGNEHNRHVFSFTQAFVVQHATTDGQGQLHKLDE